MSWIHKGFKSVREAVQANTGQADEFLSEMDGSGVIQNLDVCANMLAYYAKSGIPAYIVADYDCDGVCAGAGLYLLLREIGFQDITIRIPKRSEGYGMSKLIVDEFERPGVIITVDNGIAALDAIEEAKRRGFAVLVTDHHLPVVRDGKVILPSADLIVDPHVDASLIAKGIVFGNTFDDYCGAGIVCKLAALMIPGSFTLDMISAFAAIATVADVVSLTGENRWIYKKGIEAIRNQHITIGLQKIIDLLQSENVVDETDIGFKIGPMLNAPGRIYPGGADLSLLTLLSNDEAEAVNLAKQLDEANEMRKILKEEAVKRAKETIDRDCLYGNPIVVYDPETGEGVIGLVAGTITEDYYVSSIVFTDSKNPDIIKGSCRAPDYCHIKNSLDELYQIHPEYFAGYGGHAFAAGVSIYRKYLKEFTEGMQDVMCSARVKSLDVLYDIETDAGNLARITDEIRSYAPFGQGNPPIVVKIRDFHLIPKGSDFYAFIGKDESTLRLFGVQGEAIGFGMASLYREQEFPLHLDLVGIVSRRHFRGNDDPQVELLDFIGKKKANPLNDLQRGIFENLRRNGLA